MKVAIILAYFPQLSETFVVNHITGLIDAGHEVHIFARNTEPQPKLQPDVIRYGLLDTTCYLPLQDSFARRLLQLPHKIVELLGEPGLHCCLNPFRYGLGVLRLRALYGFKELVRDSFDIVHCHFGTTGWAFICLRDLLDAPFVTSFHGNDLTLFGGWGRLMYSRLFQLGDAFVANSSYSKQCLEKLGCPPAKIVQIPEVINHASVRRQSSLLTEEPARIITVARLIEKKGIQYCLQAIRLLQDRNYRVQYTVVGDGPFRRKLEALAQELDMEEIVKFTGWLDHEDTYAEYRRSDIFVLPSIKGKDGWIESQGLVVQEAQLHGLAVVGSRIGGIPEGLNYGQAGLLFDPGNVVDLAQQLRTLLDDPRLARSIAQAGADYCEVNYSKRVAMNRIENLYASLVHK